ncbi:cupin domain-containing protein [Mycobacterium sp. Dal123C01]|uniref:cupin domain-containing protein n=1 Tax=Mycobacterium sp. Dal123C01 TaxID=3457577 RepID=UPI00403E4DF4
MDWVSSLLTQARPGARLDTRCLLPRGARIFNDSTADARAPFHLVVEGQCNIHLTDRVVEMREGDFLLLPRGQQHEVRISSDKNPTAQAAPISMDYGHAVTHATVVGAAPAVDLFCGCYSFGFGAGRIFLASIPDPLHVNLFEPLKSDAIHLTSLLRSVAQSIDLGASVMLDSLAQVLLVLALQASPADGGPSLLNVSDPELTLVIEAVVANPGEKWTVEELARLCHVSRATLVRRFRQYTGTTIAEFVTWVRVMRAADLLRTSGRSVASVSEAVGYSSVSAFSRAFQAAVGSSPGRFAREARG